MMLSISRFVVTIPLFILLNAAAASEMPEKNDGIAVSAAEKSRIAESLGRLPLYFVENRGQLNEDVAFSLHGSDKTLYFTSQGITFALLNRSGLERKRWVVKLEFVGADPEVGLKGEERQEAVFSYFRGGASDWKTGVPAYSRLVYEDLWPGIDLVFSGTVNQLKYDFIVKPGADPAQIRLAYRGASEVSVTERGTLNVTTPVGVFEDGRPVAYQDLDGRQQEVSMHYDLDGPAGDGLYSYGFDVGPYDPGRTLVLDPAMLVYCGYIGGWYRTGYDWGCAIDVDSEGNAYVVGTTECKQGYFPVKVGPDLTYNDLDAVDAFVAKVNAEGTDLIYCGYIGGSAYDNATEVAVDSSGCAYVAGWTNSREPSFPVKIGPDLTYNGYNDAFVAKVNAQGTGLEFCGYIGGSDEDSASGIVVDDEGCVFLSGSTKSSESTFPVKVGPDLTFNGYTGILISDAFVAKVSSGGAGLVYCGYIGGDSDDYASGIALDSKGNAYVSGWTGSNESTFPVKVGPDLTFGGFGGITIYDGFVAKVNVPGTDLEYCGYIGGEEKDSAYGIVVDSEGSAYVTGKAQSDESTFPVVVGPDLTFNGGIFSCDAFIAKVGPRGEGFIYCGYIGEGSCGGDVAVDSEGSAYVVGGTSVSESDFPVVVGPDLTFNGNDPGTGGDAFVAKVATDGTALLYCGYIGGDMGENGMGIAVDVEGSAYVVGSTASSESTFPVNVGPDLTYSGRMDVFVAKIPAEHILLRAGNVNAGSGDPVDVLFINGSAGSDAARKITVPAGTMLTATVDAPPGGPIPAAFALYVMVGEAGPEDKTLQPYGIGTACFPTPLSTGSPVPPPYTLVNNTGYLSNFGFPYLKQVSPAPVTIGSGCMPPGIYTVQGFVFDATAAAVGLSLTNAVVLEIR